MLTTWKARARQLKIESYALYLACRDPRTPWYARLLAGAVVAYAFSPGELSLSMQLQITYELQ